MINYDHKMVFYLNSHTFDLQQEYVDKHFCEVTWSVDIYLIILHCYYNLNKNNLVHRYWIADENQVLSSWKVKYSNYNVFRFSKVHFHLFHTNLD